MFDDLAEQEHVFYLLDEWAESPESVSLKMELSGNSEFIRRINDLLTAIHKKEDITIERSNSRRHLTRGFSHEAQLLNLLAYKLEECDKPSTLLMNLVDIKILLLQSMVLKEGLRREGLEFEFRAILPDAKRGEASRIGGKRGHVSAYGNKAEKEARYELWQNWVEAVHIQHPTWSYEDIKRHVVKEHKGEVTPSQLKRYTKNPKKLVH